MELENRFDQVQIDPATLLRAQERDHRLKTCTMETLRKNQEIAVQMSHSNPDMTSEENEEAKQKFKILSRTVVDNLFPDLVSLYPFVQVMDLPVSLILNKNKFFPVVAKTANVGSFELSGSDELLAEVIVGELRKKIDSIMDNGHIYCPYVPLSTNPFSNFVIDPGTKTTSKIRKAGLVQTRYAAYKNEQ